LISPAEFCSHDRMAEKVAELLPAMPRVTTRSRLKSPAKRQLARLAGQGFAGGN
jgi:hypothetical protein